MLTWLVILCEERVSLGRVYQVLKPRYYWPSSPTLRKTAISSTEDRPFCPSVPRRYNLFACSGMSALPPLGLSYWLILPNQTDSRRWD